MKLRVDNVAVLDAAAIARDRGLSAIAAGRVTREAIDLHLAARRSSSIETTLAGHRQFAMIVRAQTLGYRIECAYIGTNDIAITVDSAMRFGRALGTGTEFWLNLQRDIEVWDAERSPEAKKIAKIKAIAA